MVNIPYMDPLGLVISFFFSMKIPRVETRRAPKLSTLSTEPTEPEPNLGAAPVSRRRDFEQRKGTVALVWTGKNDGK